MSKRRKLRAVENSGVGGMDLSTNPQRMQGHASQLDINGQHRKPQTWKVRAGRARAALAKQTGICRNIVYFTDKSGVERILYYMDSTGKLEGAAKPASDWSPPPAIPGGAGMTFSPVTNLAVAVPSGLTLTWTNPTSAYWRGTKITRRSDCYPQGPNDPEATTVYDGRLATATDSALANGATAYYSAYAYSREQWAVPATISGTKGYRLFLLDAALLKYSDDGGSSWSSATGLPAASMTYIVGSGTALYITQITGTAIPVYRSTDGGKTWAARTSINTGGVTALHLKPIVLTSGRIIVGHDDGAGSAISYSDDGGGSWTKVSVAASSDSWATVVNTGATVFFAGPKSLATTYIHKSTDSGATFGAELAAVGIYGKHFSICSDGTLVLGENGNDVYTGGTAGTTWALSKTVDAGYTIYGMWAYGTTILVAASNASVIRTYVSTDSGSTWATGQTISGQVLDTTEMQNCVYGYAGGWLLLARSGNLYGGTSPSALTLVSSATLAAVGAWSI